jgi:hypothetical protein
LLLQCTGYNNTFVHRGFSFESALLDAFLLLKEGEATNVLTGAVDEITKDSRAILSRFGLFRKIEDGEGAAFFLLSAEPGVARLEAIRTFYKPADQREVDRQIRSFLDDHGVEPDLVLGEDAFKPLCGEYPTSSAFALWLATGLIRDGKHRRILIYNDYLGIHHSLILVSAV